MNHGMATLTIAESKRLIAKGVAHLAQIRQALAHGTIIIAGGTTNGYVAEELTCLPVDKARYSAGIICGGRCCITPAKSRLQPLVLHQGKVLDQSWLQVLKELKRGDIFIKGGNALDYQGNVGILLASPVGGTIGQALGTLSAGGVELIIPIGLEKLIPSVIDAADMLGIQRLDASIGMACGMQVITGATIVTEVSALAALTGCKVTAAAAGGIGDSAGSTTLAFAGEQQQFERALNIIEQELKGEPPLAENARDCPCENPCRFGRSAN